MTCVGEREREREPNVNHKSKGAQSKPRHVSVILYHQLSAHDDSNETLTVGHMQALTLTLPTSKMLVCLLVISDFLL